MQVITFASVLFISKIGLVLSASFLFMACGDANHTTKSGAFDLQRLDGRWEFIDNKTFQIEEWEAIGEKQLQGKGFVLEGKDTTFIEFLSIHEQNGRLTYFAKASDMHSSEIVPFTLENQGKDELVFANVNNDFPKKIVYRLKSDSLMSVYIEGPRDGKTTRIVFDFVKQKSV